MSRKTSRRSSSADGLDGVDYTYQALIALLRRPGGDVSKEDRGSPARGIIIGLGISAILWSMIGLIVWVVLRRW